MNTSPIVDALADALDSIGVDPTTAHLDEVAGPTFAELGVDSLGVIEIVARLSSAFGIEIPDDDLDRLTRPSDLLSECAALGVPI